MPYTTTRHASRPPLPQETDYIDIPYPNEAERPVSRKYTKKEPFGLSSVVDFLRKRVTIEEIVLVGVIIIILGEEIRDEFLLIMLAYILLF